MNPANTTEPTTLTSASFALWNVWLYVLVVKRLGIQSAAFSPLLSRHRAA